ncbi:adenosylcobinamide-GDP ribazoletransferase [Geoglobus sp.]
MKSLRAGISFFSTLKAGGEFEDLTRNLYVMPAIGAIIGAVIGVLSYPLAATGMGFLAVVIYIALEGINHVDGLTDFGDAYFAPESKKLTALKDLNTGTGGSVSVSLYIILLTMFFDRISADMLIPAILLSQTLAKQGMLHLMLTSEPLWQGMVSEFVKHRKRRDFASYLITLSLALILSVQWPVQVTASLLLYVAVLFGIRQYSLKKFGGINGDVVGATNCLIFLSVLGAWTCLP